MKNILSGLSDIFSSKADTFVGIDIGSAFIKITQLRKANGRIILETYGEIALGPYEERAEGELTNLSTEKLAEALQNLMKQANVTAPRAVISISSATSLIFILKLPEIDGGDITKIVNNEVRRYIPIPLSEVTLDWWMIPEQEVFGDEGKKRNHIEILVAVVRNEIVEKYSDVAKLITKFPSPAFEIETFSAIRGTFKRELAPVLLVDIGASGTRISVIEHGVVRKFHVVNRGSAYLTDMISKSREIEFEEAEDLKKEVGLDEHHREQEVYSTMSDGMSSVFAEIQNVIYNYEREYEKPIRKIILTGGGSLLKGLREICESRYNIPTEYGDPFDKAVTPEFLEEVLDKAGPEFAVSIGLALQGLE